MPRIPADQLVSHLTALFAAESVPLARARRLAQLFTQASADGVWSHGVHRAPGLLRLLRARAIAETLSDPRLISAFGALHRFPEYRIAQPFLSRKTLEPAILEHARYRVPPGSARNI